MKFSLRLLRINCIRNLSSGSNQGSNISSSIQNDLIKNVVGKALTIIML